MRIGLKSLRLRVLVIVTLVLLGVISASTAALTYGFTTLYTQALLGKAFAVGDSFKGSLQDSLNLGLPLESLSGVSERCAQLTGKDSDIGYCMVVDSSGKVLFSDKAADIGKVFTDPVSMAAAKATTEDRKSAPVFEYGHKSYYDTVIPLSDPEGKHLGSIRLGLSYDNVYAQKRKLIFRSMLIAVGSMILAIIVFAFFVSRFITGRISGLVATAKKIASGDLTRLIETDSDDELGELGKAINGMVSNLKNMLARVKDASISVANATERIAMNAKKISEGSEAQHELTETTSSSMEEMNASIKEVAESVDSLSSSAESSSSSIMEMAASIDQVAGSTGQLSASAESTSSSIMEMAASIKQVAENMDVLSSAAEETTASATEMGASIKEVEAISKESAFLSEQVTEEAAGLGMSSVEKTIESMRNIRETVEKAAQVIEQLGGRSEEIGEILTVIDDVTDQTSLLALNAAILAAQAGEHGKGFAVVANEIKDLAERTSSSTQEIAKRISAVQTEAKDAVKSIKTGRESVEQGVQIANEAKEALKKIVQSSTRAASMSKSIEKATVEQAEGIRQVSAAMLSISNMVQQILAATQEQSQGSEQIMMASESMNDISRQVKTAMAEQTKGSKQITVAVENVSDKVQSIASATSEQKKGSQEIVRALGKIREITALSVKLAEEMDQSVSELSGQADLLREEINHFSLMSQYSLSSGKMRLGVLPLEEPENMKKRFMPLAGYLSDNLGVEVEVVPGQDMAAAVNDLGLGVTDICWLGPATYVEAKYKYGVEAIVKSIGKGNTFTRSVIVAKEGSDIKEVKDIRGRNFAFGNEKSTSSHLMPRAILGDAGIRLYDLKSYKYLGRHDAVAKAVMAGEYDAGGMMESVAREYLGKGLKIIHYSDSIANFNFSAGKKVDFAIREKLKKAFVALSITDPAHARILRAIDSECEGFTDVRDDEYDAIRKMMKRLYGIDYFVS